MKKYIISVCLIPLFICACSSYGSLMINGAEHKIEASYLDFNVAASSENVHAKASANNYYLEIGFSSLYNNGLVPGGKNVGAFIGYGSYAVGTEGVCTGPLCLGAKSRLGLFTFWPDFYFNYQWPIVGLGMNLVFGLPTLFQCTSPDTLVALRTKKFVEDLIYLYPNFVLDYLINPAELAISSPYENQPSWQLMQAMYAGKTSWLQRTAIRRNLARNNSEITDQYSSSNADAENDLAAELAKLQNLEATREWYVRFLAVVKVLSEKLEFKSETDSDGKVHHLIIFSAWDKENYVAFYKLITSKKFQKSISTFYSFSRSVFSLALNYIQDKIIISGLHPANNPLEYYDAYVLTDMTRAIEAIDIMARITGQIADDNPVVPEMEVFAEFQGEKEQLLFFARRFIDLTYGYFDGHLNIVGISNLIAYNQSEGILPLANNLLLTIRQDAVNQNKCQYVHQYYFINKNVEWCDETDPADSDFEMESYYRESVAPFRQYMASVVTPADMAKCFPQDQPTGNEVY